jgi:hypothetical protein
MFENTSCLSISLHISIIILHTLFALLSARLCQSIISNSSFNFCDQPSTFRLIYFPFITPSISRESIRNILNQYFAVVLRTFPLVLSLSNSTPATMFAANLAHSKYYLTKPAVNLVIFITSSSQTPQLYAIIVLDSLSISHMFQNIHPYVRCWLYQNN